MILAVDPGYSSYGCAIFDKHQKVTKIGIIKTEASKKKLTRVSDDNAYRISLLAFKLDNVIKRHKIKGVVGELPLAGGQSARAVAHMAMASAISVTVFALNGLPVEWYTPMEVKLAVTGTKNATKEAMMQTICGEYGWSISYKQIFTKKGKLKRTDKVYYPLNQKMGKSTFEHIADAIGAFEAAKLGNIVKMFTENKK